jgi:hypothetical protein
MISHLVIAALQQNGLSIYDGFCDDLSGLLNDPSESGPGDAHPQTGFLLRQSFQISQSQGFHLIDGQPHLLYLPEGDPPWFEIAYRWITGDDAIFLWSGQILLHFGHILNTYHLLIISRPSDVNTAFRYNPSPLLSTDCEKKRRCAILATDVSILRPAHEGHGP